MSERKPNMSKGYRVYLEDILESIRKIKAYVAGLDYEDFVSKEMVVDAVTKNLEIIGEASKHIPYDVKKKAAEVEWKKISGLRDILVHEYAGINLRIVWDVVKNKLPELERSVRGLINKSK